MDKKNIIKIAISYSGDDERPHLQKLFKFLTNQGHDLTFIGWDRLKRKKKFYESNGIKYHFIQRGWGFANLRLLLGIPLWMIRLFFFHLKIKSDLFVVSDLDSALPIAIAAYLLNRAFVYDIRDNFTIRHPWPIPIKTILTKVDSWVMKRARAIIVVDENRIIGPLECFRDKVVVIYNCPEDIANNSAPIVCRSNMPRLFTVLASGYLTSGRGIKLLLEASLKFSNIRILMAGRFVEPWLEKKALSCTKVDFRGWLPRNEALQLCFQADAIFSFYDPSIEINRRAASNKWFDAMMTGRPILANHGVIRASWIEEQKIGYLCEYGNENSLVTILEYILENREDAVERGKRGRKLFEKKYNWVCMEDRLKKLFDEVLCN